MDARRIRGARFEMELASKSAWNAPDAVKEDYR